MRDAPLHWTTHPGQHAGIEVLVLAGPLTLGNIFELQKFMAEWRPHGAVIEMTDVPYMDSAGLGVLMNFYVSAEKNGRRVALSGANLRIEAILESTCVRELLRSSSTVEEAEDRLRTVLSGQTAS